MGDSWSQIWWFLLKHRNQLSGETLLGSIFLLGVQIAMTPDTFGSLSRGSQSMRLELIGPGCNALNQVTLLPCASVSPLIKAPLESTSKSTSPRKAFIAKVSAFTSQPAVSQERADLEQLAAVLLKRARIGKDEGDADC